MVVWGGMVLFVLVLWSSGGGEWARGREGGGGVWGVKRVWIWPAGVSFDAPLGRTPPPLFPYIHTYMLNVYLMYVIPLLHLLVMDR